MKELKNELLFAKTRSDAIIPSKRDEDAGYDLYACFDEEDIQLAPHETKLIPTGICSAFNKDYVAIIKERGSTGSVGLKVSCGVIDSNFRGEWQVAIYNSTDKYISISKKVDKYTEMLYPRYPYKKAIAQVVFLPLSKLKVQEVSLKEIKSLKTNRQDRMLGSTGK